LAPHLRREKSKLSDIIKSMLEVKESQKKAEETKKKHLETEEINQEQLEKEFLRTKKKFIPNLHKFEKLFERNGFIGQEEIRKQLSTKVVLKERGSVYTQENECNLTVTELTRSKQLSRSQYENFRKSQTLRTSVSQIKSEKMKKGEDKTIGNIKIEKKVSFPKMRKLKIRRREKILTSREGNEMLPLISSRPPSSKKLIFNGSIKYSQIPRIESVAKLRQTIRRSQTKFLKPERYEIL
jgi:hypothetical protein